MVHDALMVLSVSSSMAISALVASEKMEMIHEVL